MTRRSNMLLKIDSTPFSDDPLRLFLIGPKLVRGQPMPPPVNGISTVYLEAKGGTGGYVYSINASSALGDIPPGLMLNPTTGAFSGTPTTVGRFQFQAQVQDSSATVFVANFAITIIGRLIGGFITPYPGEIARFYVYQFTATGGTGAVTWTLISGSLPAGLSLASDGRLTGFPSGSDGFSYFTVRATDGGSGDTLDVPVRMEIAPIFLSIGTAIEYRPLANVPLANAPLALEPSGGKPPYRFVWDGIDAYPWLHFNSVDGFFGTPPIADIGFEKTLNGTCYDALGYSVPVQFVWTVVYAQEGVSTSVNGSDATPADNAFRKYNFVDGSGTTAHVTDNGDGSLDVTFDADATSAGQIGIIFTNNGIAITGTVTSYSSWIARDFTIAGWHLSANTAGNATIDVQVSTDNINWTSITGSAVPSISSQIANSSTTLTGWTTTFTGGRYVRGVLSSPSAISAATLVLETQ